MHRDPAYRSFKFSDIGMLGDPKPARSDIERAIILIGKEIINLDPLFSCNFLPALLDRPQPNHRAEPHTPDITPDL